MFVKLTDTDRLVNINQCVKIETIGEELLFVTRCGNVRALFQSNSAADDALSEIVKALGRGDNVISI